MPKAHKKRQVKSISSHGSVLKTNRLPLLPERSVSKGVASSSTRCSRAKLFGHPLSPEFVLREYGDVMTPEEINEIKMCKRVYYFSMRTDRSQDSKQLNSQCFNFQRDDHIIFRYQQLELLGKGTYGRVIKCLDHRTNKAVAIKVVNNNEEDVQAVLSEKEFLHKLTRGRNACDDNHILPLKGFFKFGNYAAYVTDVCQMDLYNYLKLRNFSGIPISQVRDFGRQIALALLDTHRNGIVHCDLKPENVLITDLKSPRMMLADFGCACYENKPTQPVVQSLFYRAPEVLFGYKYSKEIDIWSFACVLFELATGRPLFGAKSENDMILLQASLLGPPPMEILQTSFRARSVFTAAQYDMKQADYRKLFYLNRILFRLDADLPKLLAECLHWLPYRRLNIQKVLEHPFFANA